MPSQGPLLTNDHLESFWDVVLTIAAKGVPSLIAIGELWLRLFSSILAPVGLTHLLYTSIKGISDQDSKTATRPQRIFLSITCLLSVASSIVLFTDTLYVLEYGPFYGGSMLIMLVLLSVNVSVRYQLRRTMIGKFCLILLALFLVYDYETGAFTFGDSAERCEIAEGLYFNQENESINKVVKHWPLSQRTYSKEYEACPWIPTGDGRTGLPFLLNSVRDFSYTRVWLPLDDGEVAALDIGFPEAGHDVTKPLYLILHGLNGGSQEGYVQDFTWRRTGEGSTVVVMIARGLGDLPIRGWDVFHGARFSDAHTAALRLRQTLVGDQILAGVGYSMGAIVLSNYVARSGENCALDSAVAISGGLDMRFEADFYRAQRLWQPMLAQTLRDDFVVGKWGERVHARLTKDQMKNLMRAAHVSEIDETAVVAYNGFRDLDHYYSEMSALGDIPIEEYSGPSLEPQRRIQSLSIPLLVIHALDDPLVTFRTVGANHGLMHPTNLTKTGTGNLLLLLTKGGGHVGWPLGWFFFLNTWKWMNDAAMSFTNAVDHSRKEG